MLEGKLGNRCFLCLKENPDPSPKNGAGNPNSTSPPHSSIPHFQNLCLHLGFSVSPLFESVNGETNERIPDTVWFCRICSKVMEHFSELINLKEWIDMKLNQSLEGIHQIFSDADKAKQAEEDSKKEKWKPEPGNEDIIGELESLRNLISEQCRLKISTDGNESCAEPEPDSASQQNNDIDLASDIEFVSDWDSGPFKLAPGPQPHVPSPEGPSCLKTETDTEAISSKTENGAHESDKRIPPSNLNLETNASCRVYNGHRFKCDICNIWLASKQRLELHKLAHSKIRRFACNICGESVFKKNFDMVRHRKICEFRMAMNGGGREAQSSKLEELNEVLRPHVCKTCKQRFCVQRELRLHNRIVHNSSSQQLRNRK